MTNTQYYYQFLNTIAAGTTLTQHVKIQGLGMPGTYLVGVGLGAPTSVQRPAYAVVLYGDDYGVTAYIKLAQGWIRGDGNIGGYDGINWIGRLSANLVTGNPAIVIQARNDSTASVTLVLNWAVEVHDGKSA